MDYTLSPNNVVDAGTGFRRHEDNQALPTVVSEKDMNDLIWNLMEVAKAAGVAGVQFDEAVPASYTVVIKAIKRLAGGNITTVNFAASPFALTADHAGLVLIDATAGNVVLNLPAANLVTALPIEYVFEKVDTTANTATVNRAGANTIDGATSFALSGQYSSRTIRGNAVDTWLTLAASATTPASQQIFSQPNPTLAANAMTLPASTMTVQFRSVTLSDGVVPAPITGTVAALVIPAGATLGTVSTVASSIAEIVMNNGGTMERAVVNLAGGVNLDETGLISTTAISAGSTSAGVVYSTTARANLPYRVVRRIDSTQTVAGNWAQALTLVQGAGGNALDSMQGFGHGQTWQNVTGSRALGTTYYNTTGKPIAAFVETLVATGNRVNLIVNGLTMGSVLGYTASNCSIMITIPVGAAYSATSPGGGSLVNWYEQR